MPPFPRLLLAAVLLAPACSPQVEGPRPDRQELRTIPLSLSGCPSVSPLKIFRSPGRSVPGDIDGDGRSDRVSLFVDRTAEPGCLALVVVRDPDGIDAAALDDGLISFELGLPRVSSLVDIDSARGLEIVIDVAQGASTAFVGVFSMASGRLERVRPPRLPNIPAGLFAHGGSVAHLDAVDCRRDLVMLSSALAEGRGYAVTRRFLEPRGTRWLLQRSLTERSTIPSQRIARFEEFSAPPFASC
ncbi:hypothetical protein BH18ACT16_BH18ACT16_13000 [soil metagenome]